MYALTDIAGIVQGNITQKGVVETVSHLAYDSRAIPVPADSLFFALVTRRQDGHRFLQAAYDKGVRAFVVTKLPPEIHWKDATVIEVPDTLQALQALSAYHRQQFRIPVIGITGSNGKTIVKEWLYQLLHGERSVVRSPKSFNSQIGVPLSVWQLAKEHEVAIIEAGISQRGEMEKLAAVIRPTIGVLTNIGEAHSEGFSGAAEKLSEKLKLFESAEVVIGPHKYVSGLTGKELFTWGGREATLEVKEIKRGPLTKVHCRYKDIHTSFTLPFNDEASIENAITCCCVLLHLGFAPVWINERMAQLHGVDMRLQLKQGINGCTLINDSYSADLTSLQLALHFMVQQQTGQRRTVILSDFDETGRSPEQLYPLIANALKAHDVQRVIAIGEEITAHMQLPASMQLQTYPSTADFMEAFHPGSFVNETVLVKGARRFRFERLVAQLEMKVHQTVLEINLNALRHNLQQYQSVLAPGTKTMAMVKAFSYGSGSAEIASVLQFHGIDYLGVAYADEGVALRKSGITVPIMVMNADASSFDALIAYDLAPVLYSFPLLEAFSKFLGGEDLQLYPVHIELETGMNRLGFSTMDMQRLASLLRLNKRLRVQSVFSHLAASEDPAQDAFTAEQATRFRDAAGILKTSLGYPFLEHIANSAAIIRHPSLQFDMVRLGIGLYGVEIATAKLDLLPVATLKTTVAQLKYLDAGDTVSYNRRGVVREKTIVATVRIGYADGYTRRLGNGVGHMFLRGALAPVIGTVCMDMTMLDVTHIPGVQEGDTVIVFGAELPVQQVAAWSGTIPYEIMTSVSQRVPRVYFQE